MNEIPKNKKMQMIGSVILLIVLLVGGFMVLRSRNVAPPTQEEAVLPENEAIPTVDANVKVELTSEDGKEVLLTVMGIPEGTESLEYELSYFNKDNNPKGVIGTINIEGDTEIERQITLGTCSSGKCVYDQGVESIKVSLKFNGDYGSKIFEKEFEI